MRVHFEVNLDDQLERERLRAIITRNLLECCDYCRGLLREQLEREEQQT